MQTKKKVDAKYYDAVISKSENIQKNWVETGRQNGKVILERREAEPEHKPDKLEGGEGKSAEQESSGQPAEAASKNQTKAKAKKPAVKPKGGNAREVLTPRR